MPHRESSKPMNWLLARRDSGDHAPHPRCHVYRLKFQEEDGRPAKDVEFEAEDSYQALFIAHQEARTRSAELWRDGQKVCSIRRTEKEIWEIWPADHIPESPVRAR